MRPPVRGPRHTSGKQASFARTRSSSRSRLGARCRLRRLRLHRAMENPVITASLFEPSFAKGLGQQGDGPPVQGLGLSLHGPTQVCQDQYGVDVRALSRLGLDPFGEVSFRY